VKCGYTGCLGELSKPRPARDYEVLRHDPETGEMWDDDEELVGEGFYVARCTRCGRGYRSLDGVQFYCGIAPTFQGGSKVLVATPDDISQRQS